jgi:hypothetical protein
MSWKPSSQPATTSVSWPRPTSSHCWRHWLRSWSAAAFRRSRAGHDVDERERAVLAPVAAGLVAAPAAQWWSLPVARDDQHYATTTSPTVWRPRSLGMFAMTSARGSRLRRTGTGGSRPRVSVCHRRVAGSRCGPDRMVRGGPAVRFPGCLLSACCASPIRTPSSPVNTGGSVSSSAPVCRRSNPSGPGRTSWPDTRGT